MATSGIFTGSRGGNSYGPWLTLSWSRIQEDIPNNRSLIRLTLKLNCDAPGGLYFGASKTGNLHGLSFTYSGGFSGQGTVTLKTRDVWVNHNSDGSKSQSFSASFNIAVSWGGSHLSSISVSGTAVIDTIPRASDFTAFTLSNTVLNTSTATTINYTLGRKSTAFSQAMTLKYGSKTIASWTTSSTGALTRTLSATEVNNIIKAMSNTTSGNLTLTMQTKSGSTNIGSPKSINEGISLNSAIKPSASGLSVAISGTGRDKTIAKYVQSISRVVASFTRSAGYGASISASTITVKRSDGKDSQTISGNSGTTKNPLGLSGTYTIIGEVKDSRGRTATVSTSITVQAYLPPSIKSFAPARSTVVTSTVIIPVDATWSPLGTSNPTTITIEGTPKGGTKTTLYSLVNSTAGALKATQTYTDQTDGLSHEYTMTLTDSFGNVAKSTESVGTSFVELSIARGQGIGVGKIHEKGSLDVSGDAYMYGFVDIEGKDGTGGRSSDGALRVHGDGKIVKVDYPGHGYIELTKNDVREGYFGFGSDGADYFTISNQRPSVNGAFYLGPQNFNLREKTGTYNGVPVFSSEDPEIWSGVSYMNESQTCTPTRKLSDCPNGWMLLWSYYSGGALDQDFNFTFIHKDFAKDFSGRGLWCVLRAKGDTDAHKYVYVRDTYLQGNARNNDSPQNLQVLRKVYAF